MISFNALSLSEKKAEIHAKKAGMSLEQWKAASKFDSTDWGWVIMSIGMAIGGGIVFLPVKAGLVGLWVFLLSSLIGYPAMYLFQKLFINTLAKSKECEDYPGVISGYLGKNWGFFLGILYILMLIIWLLVYSTAVTNDSSSYLYTFGLSSTELSSTWWYGLIVIIALVAISSRAEKILFRLSTVMALTVLGIILALGLVMIQHWSLSNIGHLPPLFDLIKEAVILLPFTLTSILFLQSLSPMVISFRHHNENIEVARYKSVRAMNIAFVILFVIVFFYALSFMFAMNYEQAVQASELNISSLAIAARTMDGNLMKILSVVLNLFAVTTSFFGAFLGFREAACGIVCNILKRFMPEEKINHTAVSVATILGCILIAWLAIILNFPVLSFTSICSPIFGLIGCLIPAYLVLKVKELHSLKTPALWFIIFAGILLVISPFLELL